MALVIIGSTKCGLCGEVIKAQHEFHSFAAFIPPGHRLHCFSDASFHHACLKACDEYQAVMDLHNAYLIIDEQRPLPSTEEAKQFDLWIENSEAVKTWQAKINKFWDENT